MKHEGTKHEGTKQEGTKDEGTKHEGTKHEETKEEGSTVMRRSRITPWTPEIALLLLLWKDLEDENRGCCCCVKACNAHNQKPTKDTAG